MTQVGVDECPPRRPVLADAPAGLAIMAAHRKGRMRFQPPQWFSVIDEVTVSLALLVATVILLVTSMLWVH